MKRISQRRKDRLVKNKRKSSFRFLKLLIFIFIAVLIFLFFKLNTKYWNGRDKLPIAVQKTDGTVEVVLLDPSLEEETIFIIPGDTEVNVSQNLGTLRIKNVWQLGINEGKGGDLLSQTVTKNFFFPVFLWSNEPPSSLKFIVAKDSNVPMGDRIALVYFSLRVKNLGKTQIDLGKSQFLTKVNLSDGVVGYKIPGEISQRLTFYFSDDDFSSKGLRVYLIDATGTFNVVENTGKIVEVMGAKVVSLEKVPKEDFDCVVWGKDRDTLAKISRVLECKIEKKEAKVDVEIKFGSRFTL